MEKEVFRAWLAREAPDAADRYRQAGRALAAAVAKSVAWEAPSGDSGGVGVVLLKLWSAGVAILLPQMRMSLKGGENTLRSF